MSTSWVTISITLVVAIVLELIRLPAMLSQFRPEWLMLTVVFWILRKPETVGIAFAFFVGMIVDVIAGVYLGIHSLALCLICYLILGMHNRFRVFPVIQQAMVVAVMVALYLLVAFTFTTLLSRERDMSEIFWQALVSGLVWPVLLVVYDRISVLTR